MAYELFIGDRAYSSWSLRGWLLFDRFGIAVTTRLVDFDKGPVADQLSELAPARTVPTLRTADGALISESLAIAEELASRHPDAGIWPAEQRARATARTLAAEMHAGFSALRAECPMDLRRCYVGHHPTDAVAADIARIETIWDHARRTCGGDGPWLCGDYSAADVFYAPVAARIAGYGLPVSDAARAYVGAHLAEPGFRRWRAMALVQGADLARYAQPYATTAWPGPEPLQAAAVEAGPSENAACPYSGRPVTHFLSAGGRTFGFCNAFCRDKTAADPAAWPAFMGIYQS